MTQPDICIIGAGSSGICAGKALRERGMAFEIFEKGSQLGGMWRYQNDNGLSSAYRSLHIDTSRKSLGYPDFPIPAHLPDYLSHEQMLAYLEAYADRFGVRQHVRFNNSVQQVEPLPDGLWQVRLESGGSRSYRAVIVANGHLSVPRMASFAGQFNGRRMHSHHYRTAAPFEGQRVLVVGIGNSAVDIAVDLCRHAKRVCLSTRRGAWLMPKYIMGIPTDRWSAFINRRLRLPTRWTRTIMAKLAYLAIGDQERFGVPRPAHPIWREHACVSQDLLSCVGHGWIGIKPDIRELQGDEVLFADGSREAFDTLVLATGYETRFPFLDPAVFAVRDHDVRLYRRIAAPERPGLFFIGLVQPVGPTIPLVEVQARWLAALLGGSIDLPDRAAMHAEIDAHLKALRERYVDSARYTLEVDYREHAGQLRRDMAAARAKLHALRLCAAGAAARLPRTISPSAPWTTPATCSSSPPRAERASPASSSRCWSWIRTWSSRSRTPPAHPAARNSRGASTSSSAKPSSAPRSTTATSSSGRRCTATSTAPRARRSRRASPVGRTSCSRSTGRARCRSSACSRTRS
jgi:dimethylaniline monooxygenase (N-oxide forming)